MNFTIKEDIVMAKRKRKVRKRKKSDMRKIAWVVPTGTATGAEGETFYQCNGGGEVSPLITQILSTEIEEYPSAHVEETDNLDAIAAMALYELRCQGVHFSSRTLERIYFLAEIVEEKYHGWQVSEMPTTQNLWAGEKNRFLFAYLLSCRMSTQKRIYFLKNWLSKGHLGDFFSAADRGRRNVLKNIDTPLVQCDARKTGIMHMTAITSSNFMDDYFDQLLFYAFNAAPIVFLQTAIKRQKGFHPAITVSAYDKRYLDFTPFLNEVAEELSGEMSSISTNIKILEPSIQAETFLTGHKNFSAITEIAEKHYKPPV